MYKLFLINRYLRKRLIALFAIVSVWLCVAMVIVVISVMGGFLNMVKEHSRGLLSDIIVDNETIQGFPYYDEFISQLYTMMPETVAQATPVIYNYGILRVKLTDFTKPVQVVGVKLDEYRTINSFGDSLYYDTYYPGTTSLATQKQAFLGVGEGEFTVLPAEYATAWASYQAEHPDDPDLAEFKGRSIAPFPGYFEVAGDGPGYAGEAQPGVIVGVDLICERLKDGGYADAIPLGSELVITVLPMTRRGVPSGEGAMPIAMRYADRSRTKVYDIDKMCVYVDFDVLQNALSMERRELETGVVIPPRASQILVRLHDGQGYAQAKLEIEALWKDFMAVRNLAITSSESRLLAMVRVETWEERQRQYISAVEKEKVLVTFLFAIISVVAIVLIGCIFYMIVSHKTRDIGIIKSVGASSCGIASIFLGFGLAVGVVGSVLGTVSGVLIVRYINDIQDALAWLNPNLQVWSPDVYVFDRIPNQVDLFEVGVIVVVAVFASMLGALIPAILAARVWPVEALRYE